MGGESQYQGKWQGGHTQQDVHLSSTAQPVRTALQAAGRVRWSRPCRKQPLLLPALQQVCAVDTSSWIAVRDSALYALGWHGMLREAEVAALQWDQISMEGQGLVLLIQSSKTNQAAQASLLGATA